MVVRIEQSYDVGNEEARKEEYFSFGNRKNDIINCWFSWERENDD